MTKKENPMTVTKLASMGGKARAKVLSVARIKAIARMGGKARKRKRK